jgi:hypothetical protein
VRAPKKTCGKTWFGREMPESEALSCMRPEGHAGKHCTVDTETKTMLWWEADKGRPIH